MNRTPQNARRLKPDCDTLEAREVLSTAIPTPEPAIAPGLTAEFYAIGGYPRKIPNLDALTPDATRVIPAVIQAPTVRPWTGLNLDDRFVNKFAVKITGFLRIDNPGHYRFTMQSDDGVRMWVDGKLAINDDGVHRPRPRNVDLNLSRGYHSIRIDTFDQKGPSSIALTYTGHDIREPIIIPPSQFAHLVDPTTSQPIPSSANPAAVVGRVHPRGLRRGR